MKTSNTTNISEKITGLIDAVLLEHRDDEPKRNYLGASRLGVECSRALQYEYLHLPKDIGCDFSARTLRIFEAGHLFESMISIWLKQAGFNLLTEDKQTGRQYGFSALDGNLQGHIDGVLVGTDAPLPLYFPMLFECKALNNSSWNAIKKKGLTEAQPVYAGQVAIYQAYMNDEFPGIADNPALFVSLNKNTSELYFEEVPFNPELAQKTSDKALNIIEACEVFEWLPRISKHPTYYTCKMCAWKVRCWESATPNKSTNPKSIFSTF